MGNLRRAPPGPGQTLKGHGVIPGPEMPDFPAPRPALPGFSAGRAGLRGWADGLLMRGRTGDAKKKTIVETDRSLCVGIFFKGRAAGEPAGAGSGPILIKYIGLQGNWI